ncbi:TPA: flagellin [Vibrio parahaemolyticus]
MLSITTNLNANQAATSIGRANQAVQSSSEKLTTGLRINKSADDVSGAALANRLANSSAKTAQFIKNANDGINMIQAADNAIKQQQDLVARMQELAYKAENGTNTDKDTALIQKEFAQLSAEVLRNETGAEFNGKKLLNGDLNAAINVGTGAANQINVSVAAPGAVRTDIIADDGTIAMDLSAARADGDVWNTEVHAKLELLAENYANNRADLGASQNRIEFSVKNLEGTKANLDKTLSSAQDTDFATETAELAKAKVLAKTSQTMLSQANKSVEEVSQLLQ